MLIQADRYPNIASDPNIQGGAAVVRGTRLPIRTLAFYWRAGWDRSRLLDSYPQFTPEMLDEALRFYQEHRQEIDAELHEIPAM